MNCLVFGLIAFLSIKPAQVIFADYIGEFGDKFEGDILLTRAQNRTLNINGRNGLINSTYHWANKTIPYVIDLNYFCKLIFTLLVVDMKLQL